MRTDAASNLLLAMADDETVLGWWHSEWTGIAPMLEEDVAMSSIAQDEIGHARFLYEIAADRLGTTADRLALGREPSGYRNAILVERRRGDWAHTIVRQWFYDEFDDLRTEALTGSALVELKNLIAKVRREEKYHLLHTRAWMERLAAGGEVARARLQAALETLWPDALGLFEAPEVEGQAVKEGVSVTSSAALAERWTARVRPVIEGLGLGVPAGAKATEGGRAGRHTSDFEYLWNEMTMVYRSDPAAVW